MSWASAPTKKAPTHTQLQCYEISFLLSAYGDYVFAFDAAEKREQEQVLYNAAAYAFVINYTRVHDARPHTRSLTQQKDIALSIYNIMKKTTNDWKCF